MQPETEQTVAAIGGWGVLMLGNGLARADQDLLGKRLDAAAKERGVEPFPLACDLLTRGSPSTLGFGISEPQMDRILTMPWCLVASDGSALPASGRTGHPRSFGTFPRVIRRHVREQRLAHRPTLLHRWQTRPLLLHPRRVFFFLSFFFSVVLHFRRRRRRVVPRRQLDRRVAQRHEQRLQSSQLFYRVQQLAIC